MRDLQRLRSAVCKGDEGVELEHDPKDSYPCSPGDGNEFGSSSVAMHAQSYGCAGSCTNPIPRIGDDFLMTVGIPRHKQRTLHIRQSILIKACID